MLTATSRIDPRRVAEASNAVESLIEDGIHCNWAEVTRTLKYFFEDLTAEMSGGNEYESGN